MYLKRSKSLGAYKIEIPMKILLISIERFSWMAKNQTIEKIYELIQITSCYIKIIFRHVFWRNQYFYEPFQFLCKKWSIAEILLTKLHYKVDLKTMAYLEVKIKIIVSSNYLSLCLSERIKIPNRWVIEFYCHLKAFWVSFEEIWILGKLDIDTFWVK